MTSETLLVRKKMCKTCPFREGSPYAHLKEYLTGRSYFESRTCHQTGKANGVNPKDSGIEDHLCRGSRQIQLQFMYRQGFIQDPTDDSWNEARKTYGMKPQIVQDPEKK